jgi:hypothetical protein
LLKFFSADIQCKISEHQINVNPFLFYQQSYFVIKEFTNNQNQDGANKTKEKSTTTFVGKRPKKST